MIQNSYFGDRNALPFDLKIKAGPIQFYLSPDATSPDIKSEKAKLKATLVDALALCLAKPPTKNVVFPEVATTWSPYAFFIQSDVLASVGKRGVDEIEYRFAERHAFYLRLIPTTVREKPLKLTELEKLVEQRKLDVLTRSRYSSRPGRNQFGAITYEPHGTSTVPSSFSQAFRNGELWSVTIEFHVHRKDGNLIPTTNVGNAYERVLENFCEVATNEFGIGPPYEIVMGAAGLSGFSLATGPYQASRHAIKQDAIQLRRTLHSASISSREKLLDEFLDELFDLVSEHRPPRIGAGFRDRTGA